MSCDNEAMTGNTYWKAPGATAYIKVGLFPSNTWVGNGRAYGNAYHATVLADADVIADLCGGMFIIRDGVAHEARFTPQERHLFERGGATKDARPRFAYRVQAVPFPGRTDVPVFPDFPSPFVAFGAMDALV